MARFNDLPNEIILTIIPLVLPDDLESFSSTCRLIKALATRARQQHQELKREYRTWTYAEPWEPYKRLHVLLRMILENPRLAYYVKELKVRRMYLGWPSKTDDKSPSESDDESVAGAPTDPADDKFSLESEDESVAGAPTDLAGDKSSSESEDDPFAGALTDPADDDVVWFKKAVRKCIFVSPDEYEEWDDDLDGGCDDPILALLVTRLPNLKKLDILIDPEVSPLFLETIQRISEASSTLDPLIPLSRLTWIPLSRLTEVTVIPRRSLMKISSVWPFLALPSVKLLESVCVDHDEMIPLQKHSSKVIQLNWARPWEFTEKRIENFFSIFKDLQVFRLSPEYSQLIIPWDLLRIHDSLLLHARHTLKQLSLYVDDMDGEDHGYIGSLHAFECLKRLEIGYVHLLGRQGPSRKTLAEVLPMSIEDVSLQNCVLPRQEYRRLVIDLLRVKYQSVPSLKRLSFQQSFFNPHLLISEDNELKMACKRAGFTLVISRDRGSG